MEHWLISVKEKEEDEKKIAVCRVCLNCDLETNGKGLSIFEEQNECVITDKINALASVDIKEGDGLPDRICSACLLDLETAYNFKLKCESTNQVLLSSLNTPTKLEDDISMKEEFLSENDGGLSGDDGQHGLDENITQEPLEVPKLSKAIDLKLVCDDCGGSFKSKCKLRVHWKRVHMPVRLKCHRCCKKFKSYRTYNMHQKKKTKSCLAARQFRIEGEGKNRIYFCKECDYKSQKIHAILVHLVVHTGEHRFKCEMLPKKFSQHYGLQANMEPLEVPKPSKAIDLKLICNDCGDSFRNKLMLRVHWKRVHMIEKLKCPSCLKNFKSYRAYNKHQKRKTKSCITAGQVCIEGEAKNRIYYCKECDYKSHKIELVRAHLVVHTGERRFKCVICTKKFSQHCGLQAHNESQHPVNNMKSTCPHCGKQFHGRIKMNAHIRLVHSSTSYPCTVCTIILKTKHNLTEHMKRHSGVKAYACEVCTKSYFTLSDLINHKTTVHVKPKKYNCDLCQYTGYNLYKMKEHKSKHSPTNEACQLCGMFLEGELQLLLHMKRHTDRNYPCSQCDKTYTSRKNLTAHLRAKHTDMNFPCSQCNKKYYSRKNLTDHVRVKHTIIQLSSKMTKVNKGVKSETV